MGALLSQLSQSTGTAEQRQPQRSQSQVTRNIYLTAFGYKLVRVTTRVNSLQDQQTTQQQGPNLEGLMNSVLQSLGQPQSTPAQQSQRAGISYKCYCFWNLL